MVRRSFWGWGLESDQPTDEERREHAARLSARWGREIIAPPIPRAENLGLRTPRVPPPPSLRDYCTVDAHERALHTYGKSFVDGVRAVRGVFPNPPDFVALPRNEAEVTAALEWAGETDTRVITFGGGSSVVGGVEGPEAERWISLDLGAMNRVLEVDHTSRAARIEAGVLGPHLEDQLRPEGLTLRHYPQSFEWSSLGGWIATRSGGHYATNQTHIDDFVESVRMLTPRGPWESRRLPGSGAGPSPDRLVIGSEGILGVITEAWVRLQGRPRFRASAGVQFRTWEAACEGVRLVVQAKLWPANVRILDPLEARNAAGGDGSHALMVLGFESADVPQGEFIKQAVRLAREAGGEVADADIRVADGSEERTGHAGSVGEWRNSFVRAPYGRNLTVGCGVIGDTFETAITWDRWPEFDRSVRAAMTEALERVCGGGSLSCRFTHAYTDGPAPYYTFSGLGRQGGEIEMWKELKKAASDAVLANGGTITHHHAVGRDHRPWYDIQRPSLFTDVLRAAKKAVDPRAILNPGVLIDP